MSAGMNEAAWEALAMDSLGEIGWLPLEGKKIAPGSGERESWSEVIIPARLRAAITRINPDLPASAAEEALKVVLSPKSRDAKAENFQVHRYLTEGIRSVVYADEHGAEHNPVIRLIDYADQSANDFLAVNQVVVTDGEHKRRFDIVLYLNGMPMAMIELKNAGNAAATPERAHAQVMTYVRELPLAFRCNVACVATDGIRARYGTAFTPFEHFCPWNVDEDGKPVKQPSSDADLAINLLLYGLFDLRRFLEIVTGYVEFAQSDNGLVKRIAKPHQYFAVSKAVGKTIEAVRSNGHAGVVWHTQGSGKSMEMELYANQVLRHRSLGNPTIVVLTDRTDLDDQLYGTFEASELLPESPVQVLTRDQLRAELASRRHGGISFSTLQKFGRTKEEKESGQRHPLLSDRRNIIVIVDEAHRSHYDDLDGYARHLRDALPHATMIAFTGTPIAEAERDTRAVFGDIIDTYDLTRAVDDEATVPVYYEPRHIPVDLPDDVEAELIDERADEVTAGLDDSERERIQQAVAVMNALYGAPDRLRTLAADLVAHWEARSDQMRKFIGGPGKAIVVCATRQICADLYKEIVALRPDWHHDDIDKGKVKVVYTGGPGDPEDIQAHVRRPSLNKLIQRRAKDVDDDLEVVIVQSMWLTGFDSPPLNTLYLDRPMRGAALMQALARVNRTFRGKPSGLLVGYAPLTENLYAALAEYTSAEDRMTRPLGRDIDEAMARVRELLDTVGNVILAGYNWRSAKAAKTPTAFPNAVTGAINYLRDPATPGNQPAEGEPTLAERFRFAASKLARFYSLCSSHKEMAGYRDDIAFFENVRIWMAKLDADDRRARGLPIPAEVELYLRQLTAGAVEAGEVTDLYAAAGVPRPDLSHLDEAFLERMLASRHPHLAIESLRRLVEQEMRRVTRHNIVRQQSFSDRLLALMTRYTNQSLSSAQVIAELFAMATEVSADASRGAQFSPPLADDELAFYDAVAQNESAVTEMGTGVLADIARDLVRALRRDVTTDWVSRDDVRAKLRSTIKRLLAKHGYPPDAEPAATALVLRQMETFAEDWSPRAS